MADRVTEDDLLTSAERGAITLLPGAFAARSWRSAFDDRQRASGKKAWESPRFLSWSEWTRSLWTQLVLTGAESRLLLNKTQEQSLWSELILDQSSDPLSPEAVDPLVRLAQSAWALAGAWNLVHRLGGSAATYDTRTFARWALEFERRLAERGYFSVALLDQALAQHLDRSDLSAPRELQVANFPEFAPSQARLLAALRNSGCSVEIVSTALHGGDSALNRVFASALTEREELGLAARWARLEAEGSHGRSRPLRIALIPPERAVEPSELEAVLREVLAPELQAIDTDLSSTPWEFTAGETLSGIPLAAAALDLARLCVGPISLEAASALLLSPYLGHSTDHGPNAWLDAYALRGPMRLRPEITLQALASAAAESATSGRGGGMPVPWSAALNELAARTTDPKLRRSFSEWMEVLRHLLRTAGWPGDRALSLRESNAVRAWEDTLDEVATLDFAGKRVSFLAALHAVEQKAASASLPSSTGIACVTVLGLDEAVGARWDALVFLRGAENHWPPTPRLHPLLGAGLQRELGLPGTRPERERDLMASVLSTARVALATRALENADGPLRPAPVFNQLGFVNSSAPLLPPAKVPKRIPEQILPDHAALPPLPSPDVRGGARVLQLQAACGFLAFAAVRLRATEMEAREAGFDPRESGNFLHRSLEHFWKQVGSQAALRALTPQQRSELLRQSIEQAFRSPVATDRWDRAYLELQNDRLHRLLSVWLTRELARSPFTVAESESDAVVAVGPLNLHVRVDRMDRLDDEQKGVVLVDYKSGAAAEPRHWTGERPDEPQLPLYALRCEPDALKAVAFARIRAGTIKWSGWEAEKGVLPASTTGIKDLPAAVEGWRSTLTQLATHFSEGRAEVDPKDFTQNCKRCEQRLLCRLDSAALDGTEFLEEEEQEETYG